jgi:diguanylate cyclase
MVAVSGMGASMMRAIAAHRLQWVIGAVVTAAVVSLSVAAAVAVGMPAPDWKLAGLVAAGTLAGYHLQVVYRVGSQRLILVWCQAAAAVGLVLLPAPWVVITTAVGWAVTTFGPGGLGPLKAAFNTALNTTAAAGAALAYQVVHSGPLRLTSWTGPAAVALAMLVFSAVVELGVPAVMAAASGRSFGSTFRDGLATRCLQVSADLMLAVVSGCAAVAAPRLLIALPAAAGIIHVGYRSAVAARTERQFGQRLAAALRAVGSGERDRVSVAGRAVEQVGLLLAADTVELVLHGSPPLLVRYTVSGQVWSGPPAGAGVPVGQVAEVLRLGDAGQVLAELRVFFAIPVRLGERERSGMGALAAAADTALRTAAAYAELAAASAAAAHAASHDATTGLPVRRLLLEWTAEHLQRCRLARRDDPVALICVNIKGFAEMRGSFSAEVADQLLVHAAGRLAAGVGDPERLAHLGGDTFAVWVPAAAGVEFARERAFRLLSVMSAPAVVGSGPVMLSGVAGLVYAHPLTTSSAEELLRQGLAALRVGHRLRQQVTVYRPEDDIRGQSAIVLTSELGTAIQKGQLQLTYQPVLELATGNPVAVEAQPRWLHPARGLLPEREWMPVLEQSDLVGRYVSWLLDKALAARDSWDRDGVAVPVAVRLPGPAVLDPALPATVVAALSRAGLTASQLVVELTGSEVWTVADTVVDSVLAEFVEHGVGLAVDVGRLPLEQLGRIPASEIRLAGPTTSLLLSDQEVRARVRATVAFAEELGLRVTAQDIPTLEHVNELVRLRVQAGQGPCLSRPRLAGEIAAALRLASELAVGARNAKVITLPVRDR